MPVGSLLRRELPPTAGLPLRVSDLLPGPARLAETVAAQLGTPSLLPTCSGTAALTIALMALRDAAPHRQRVVIPAYTCPLVALAVRHAGLTCVPCELLPSSIDFDPDALAAACDERTLALVPTHLAGRVADVASARRTADQVGAWVIEDAAQALGARQDGRSVGLAGDIGFFSLAAGKGLSIYEGGLLLAHEAGLRERLARTAAQVLPYRLGWELKRSAELLGYAGLYRPRGLGLAYGAPLRRALDSGDPVGAVGDRFDPAIPLHRVGRWRQGVGTRAARRWPAFLDACTAQALRRLPRLRAIAGVQVLGDAPGQQGSWPFLLLLLPSEAKRDAALDLLWRAGTGISRLFIHALPDYLELRDCVPPVEVPRARDFAARSLTVSNSPWLDDAAFEAICRTLERVLAD